MKKLNSYDALNVFVFLVVIVECILILNVKTDYTQIRPTVEPIPSVCEEPAAVDVKFPVSIYQVDDSVKCFSEKKDQIIEEDSIVDTELMARVVRAEAGNQDEVGKRLIVDVILNRVDSPSFPDTIYDVCHQPNQFAIAYDYTNNDMLAVLHELESRTDREVIFFRTNRFHNFGVPAYQHGDHFFSKEDLKDE